MKTLINLQAEAVEAEWSETRGIVSAAHCEVGAGCFVHVTLGGAGFRVFSGKTEVGIPLSELVKLAQKHVPELMPKFVCGDGEKAREAAARTARDAAKLAAKANPQSSILNPQ